MKKIVIFFMELWTASIRRQLMVGIILVHAVLMSIFVFDLVERQTDFLHTQSVQQAKSLSETLAVNSISWVLANDVVGLEEVMEAQKHYPSLRSAMVLDNHGRILGHTDVNKVGLYLNDSISAKLIKSKDNKIVLINNNQTIDIATQIYSNGVSIGWARVNLTQEENSKNLQVILQNGLLYTILAIVVGAFFAFFMAKGITTGLKQIVDVAEGINLGDQTLRANVSRHDEIGTLGKDFNVMLDTIAKSKRDLQGIMDNSPTVIYVKDINGQFTFINNQFEKLFHLKRKDLVGKTLFDIFPKEIAEEMQKNDKDVIEVGHALESEEMTPQDDGIHIYTSIKFPLYDDSENIYAVCGISTDITDRINMEKEKAALESQLLHTQKMQAIGQLTGGVAHDFNNLLAVILGYTDLSKRKFGKGNEDLIHYLQEIETAGIRGRELIKQMMIYSHKDQYHNDVELINIDKALKETVSMLRATFPAGISIKTFIDKNIPPIKGSASLISQVLMNLCINAKDGMGKEGELEIKLAVESFEKGICHACHETYSGNYVVINIKDNGSGIPEEIINRIFEPFFTSKKVGEGTGMGLSVVHGVVHKLGGHILVDSVVNQGTVFKILLPIATEKEQTETSKVVENLEYDFSGLNIMVVDDEPSVAALLEESLGDVNANVIVFTDSKKALAHYAKAPSKIDIVITDQTMPNLTGVGLSKKILELNADAKIILCTGHSAYVTEKTALDMGIKVFVFKPVKMADLNNIINDLK